MMASPYKATVPVICVGNITVGGAGKTPTCLYLAQYYLDRGMKPAFVTRGYLGNIQGPVNVDVGKHTAKEVGDEALLLANLAPTYVAKNRAEAVCMAQNNHPDVIIMDDGLQNPTVHKDCNILVIDGIYGLGNEHIIPAGPLRASLKATLQHIDSVIIIGKDNHNIIDQCTCTTVLSAHLKPVEKPNPEAAYIAFAGIGRPEKFFTTLKELSLNVIHEHAFGDHHPYTEKEMDQLISEANTHHAKLITTQKDLVRIKPQYHKHIVSLAVTLAMDEDQQKSLISVLPNSEVT
tara:strand:+ start:556 stop:1428 length:873 start_codon:yes stop_codon:yes gene_type:complete